MFAFGRLWVLKFQKITKGKIMKKLVFFLFLGCFCQIFADDWYEKQQQQWQQWETQRQHDELMRKLDNMQMTQQNQQIVQQNQQRVNQQDQEHKQRIQRYKKIYETARKEKQLDECFQNFTKQKGSTKPCIDYLDPEK